MGEFVNPPARGIGEWRIWHCAVVNCKLATCAHGADKCSLILQIKSVVSTDSTDAAE